jgi:hypothetical protein
MARVDDRPDEGALGPELLDGIADCVVGQQVLHSTLLGVPAAHVERHKAFGQTIRPIAPYKIGNVDLELPSRNQPDHSLRGPKLDREPEILQSAAAYDEAYARRTIANRCRHREVQTSVLGHICSGTHCAGQVM